MKELLEAVQEMLSRRFGADPSHPGVLISYVPERGWYVSAQRYTRPYGEGKQIVARAYGITLGIALSYVASELARAEAKRTRVRAWEEPA